MEQRDYLMKRINQFAQVLGFILAKLLGLKNQEIASEEVQTVSSNLKNELGIDLDDLIEIQTDKLMDVLLLKEGFNNENLELLAEIIVLLADEISKVDNVKAKKMYERALVIYEYLEEVETTYSINDI